MAAWGPEIISIRPHRSRPCNADGHARKQKPTIADADIARLPVHLPNAFPMIPQLSRNTGCHANRIPEPDEGYSGRTEDETELADGWIRSGECCARSSGKKTTQTWLVILRYG
jgi:hypothetical protein